MPGELTAQATTGRCLNCDAVPAGPWCQECGQQAGPAHRSLRHLAAEMLELLTHADSRLWRTLRRLLFRPAELTSDFLAGRRVRQIPPLRLFFVILLLLFTVGSLTHAVQVIKPLPAQDRIEAEHQIESLETGKPWLDRWLRPHLRNAVDHPDVVMTVMGEWLERFILLLPPIAAVMLRGLTAFSRRRFTLFDHTVFSLHSLSFAGLVQIAVFLFGTATGAAWLLLGLLPVHLFSHMRGVYGGPVPLVLLRMALLGLGSVAAAIVLLLGLAWVGLQFGIG